MTEHESDILIVEETETEQISSEKTEKDSLFESKPKRYDNLFETYVEEIEDNKTAKKEAQTFTNYNNNKLNKVYKKYDVVQTYVPRKKQKKTNNDFDNFVNEQNSYTPEIETLTVEKVAEKTKYRLSSKAKVWICAFALIAIMLGSVCIYNAVEIKRLNTTIQETSTNLNNVNKDIETIIKDIGVLTDEETVKIEAGELGMDEIPAENNIQIELLEKNKVETYESETNFFDKICNFFRNIFGG